MPHLSGCPERSLAEVTRTFTTSVLLWRESAVRDFFRWSITELSQPVGIEPTTIGLIEVTRSFSTPQTFLRFFVTSRCPVSLLRTRTPVAPSEKCSAVNPVINKAKSAGIGAYGLSGFKARVLAALSDEAAVNFTIPGSAARPS